MMRCNILAAIMHSSQQFSPGSQHSIYQLTTLLYYPVLPVFLATLILSGESFLEVTQSILHADEKMPDLGYRACCHRLTVTRRGVPEDRLKSAPTTTTPLSCALFIRIVRRSIA